MFVTTPVIGALITVSRLASTCAIPSCSSLIWRSTCSTCARDELDRRLLQLRRREVALHLAALANERLLLDLLVGDLVLLRLHESLGDELLLAGEPRVARELVLRALDAHFLQLHFAVDLRELDVEVFHAAAILLDLLHAEVAPLRLLLFEDRAAVHHLGGDGLVGGRALARGSDRARSWPWRHRP